MTNRTDNFNRADTANNIGTPSDGGSAWVQYSGTWGIASDQGYQSAVSTTNVECALESSVANVTVQVTIAAFEGVADANGLCARLADDSNYLLMFLQTVTNTIALYKKVAGSFTLLASASVTPAAGDVAKMTCDSSNLITGYRNGAALISATDSAGSTNTKHGLWYSAATGTGADRFDDFSITALGGVAAQELSLMTTGVGA